MTPDGRFVDPPASRFSAQLFRYGVIVAALASMLAIAAIALWFALILIPVAAAAALVAWASFRWNLWRARRSF